MIRLTLVLCIALTITIQSVKGQNQFTCPIRANGAAAAVTYAANCFCCQTTNVPANPNQRTYQCETVAANCGNPGANIEECMSNLCPFFPTTNPNSAPPKFSMLGLVSIIATLMSSIYLL